LDYSLNHGNKLGGFAEEWSGNASKNECLRDLLSTTIEMVDRRDFGKFTSIEFRKRNVSNLGYIVIPSRFVYKSLNIRKKFGTVIAAICFV